jgi:hypothetical protein
MDGEDLVGHTTPSVDFLRRLDLEQNVFADTIIVIELDIGKTNGPCTILVRRHDNRD